MNAVKKSLIFLLSFSLISSFSLIQAFASTNAVYDEIADVQMSILYAKGMDRPSAAYVELWCDTPGVTIYYTTDGTWPTTASNVYTGSLSFYEPTYLYAIAVKEGPACYLPVSFFQ